MNDLISVIVPIYNAEKHLKECLNSIINQTYTNLEILLINDGSTDNSAVICEEYCALDKRVKVIHTKNRGVSYARNKGLNLANGTYIAFVDSDDYVSNEYISAMYSKNAETNSELTFCYFSKLVGDNIIQIRETIPDFIDVNIEKDTFANFICRFFNFRQNIFGSCCRVLFKKKLIQNIRFEENIIISEDLLFLLHAMMNANHISSIHEHLYIYRQTDQSTTFRYKVNYLDSQIALYRELKETLDLFGAKNGKGCFEIYYCLLCYYVLSNEIKYKHKDRKENIKKVRNSELYKYFCLINGLNIYGIKKKIKFLIIWFLVKTKVF